MDMGGQRGPARRARRVRVYRGGRASPRRIRGRPDGDGDGGRHRARAAQRLRHPAGRLRDRALACGARTDLQRSALPLRYRPRAGGQLGAHGLAGVRYTQAARRASLRHHLHRRRHEDPGLLRVRGGPGGACDLHAAPTDGCAGGPAPDPPRTQEPEPGRYRRALE